MSWLIKCNNVTFRTRNDTIIHHFNYTFGDHTCITGINGVGKTTLLNLISGAIKPTSGTVEYNLELLGDKNVFGMQSQEILFPPTLTVKNIIHLFHSLHAIQVDENNLLFKSLNINKIMFKNASDLSGGEKRRLDLYLAMFYKPKILLLDEFSAHLDKIWSIKCLYIVKQFCKQNKIMIIFVSHTPKEIKYLSKKIVVL